ncbi:hypothetical protein P153DRAFT_427340 [Dothidotthia symphoricarpi CBS 119687]|uniref:BTB domain-containing protein n=1 Tax=Dothidotthia symphoricarpi CBS 119687 TaxID=1392245 RepID=A0A6A6AUR5_9PLEO|nr:uncharacterized protein P153DRAFT_427340 [Dothidotthia symphoricarpi CBS 119687]KAF2134684.1 hypothetical protein P153DRAFT_427340 [Dothidotthia symphoricarpi CBS 119687]
MAMKLDLNSGDEAQLRDAHMCGELGYARYCDVKALSDITVRYGQEGERVFYGHRIMLCSVSRWFQAAFTVNLQGNELQEITLEDDDTDAVQHMLYHAYGLPSPSLPTASEWLDHLRYNLNLYQVAEKYSVPSLATMSVGCFKRHWDSYLDDIDVAGEDVYHSYQDVVQRVYIVARAQDGEHRRDHPLVKILLDGTITHQRISITKDHDKILDLFTKAADDVAEFGRDIFVHMMNSTKPKTDTTGCISITWTNKFTCPECEHAWIRTHDPHVSEVVSGHCPECDTYFSDWNTQRAS